MKKLINAILVAAFICGSLSAQMSRLPYPHINALQSDDVMFSQYQAAVSRARKAIATMDTSIDISPEFYTYTVQKGDDIIDIAARCCIPYDAIVTLNRISSAEEDIVGRTLVLPSLPALYVHETGMSSLETLVSAYVTNMTSPFEGFQLNLFATATETVPVYCVPNALFDGTIRSFFFVPYYRYPLDEGVITSNFGLRSDPFTGRPAHHSGIDIAAKFGTAVHAIAAGTVTETGNDSVLGRYVIIKHKDGRKSVYGHLSTVLVSQETVVKSGTVVGTVGSTGRSTGNHLHLEIRESNIAKDPVKFFKE